MALASEQVTNALMAQSGGFPSLPFTPGVLSTPQPQTPYYGFEPPPRQATIGSYQPDMKTIIADALVQAATGQFPGSEATGLFGQVVYHGTSRAAANAIDKQGFKLEKFGSGADRDFASGKTSVFGLGQRPGFYGKGIYFTESPRVAKTFASRVSPRSGGVVIKADIDDTKLFNATKWDEISPTIRDWWIKKTQLIREQKNLPRWSNDKLSDYFDSVIDTSGSGRIEAINEYAITHGHGGIKFSPSEIVVFDETLPKIMGRE